MTYPPPKFVAETPVAGNTFRQAGHPAEISKPNGNAAHYLATGELTDAAFGLYRWEMGAVPSGPDPHYHRSIAESFFVLAGTVRLYDGERWIDSSPGDFLYVAQGGVHAFRNESGEPASMLLLFTPGAPREDYFERVGSVGGTTEDERRTFFAHHDTFWV